MSFVRRIVLRLLVCLAVAAGPVGHGLLAAQAATQPQSGLTATHSHCQDADEMAGAAQDESAPDRAKAMKSGGCQTQCCAMTVAAIAFDAGRARQTRAPDGRAAGEAGGVVRPPLPPPRA